MAWHLAAITLTRGGRCNIAHCPPPIYSNGPLSSRRSSFFPLPSALPRLHTHTPDALLLPFDFYFPFLSFFPPPSTSSVLRRGEPRVRRASPLFRHAREPLISADFARRVDPWNPCSCLSPAPARAGTSFHPSFLLALSFSPSAPPPSTHFLLPSFQLVDLVARFFVVTVPSSKSQERGFLFLSFFFFIYEDRGILYIGYRGKTV